MIRASLLLKQQKVLRFFRQMPNSVFFEMSQWHLTNNWGLELYLYEDYEETEEAPDPDWEWEVEDGQSPAPTVVPWTG